MERVPLSACCASWSRGSLLGRSCVFCGISPHPGGTAFAFYGAWILAYLYVIAAFFETSLPGVGVALLLGLVLMLTFLVVYRRVVFPDLFGGVIAGRWQAIHAAAHPQSRNP